MSKALVIVESPAKARTLAHFLGEKYAIKASLGHIRDLPQNKLGIDVDNDFEPVYQLVKGKEKVVRELGAAAKAAPALYLATDPDREGEAIAWHLVKAIRPDLSRVKRVEFHEITREAVQEAFRHPRSIDMNLVQAQQARRILDRLVGYNLSPLLWRKVAPGLSAGRVQSAALRLVADREQEIQAFVSQEYWTVEVEFLKDSTPFRARLVGLKDGTLVPLPTREQAEEVSRELEGARYRVGKVAEKVASRQPSPPFITSTLQQEAYRKLGFSPERTMRVAQQLYEGIELGKEGAVGLITYMRTDSTRVSPQAIAETRQFIRERFGPDYLPPRPRFFTRKVKGAQEAHEAIRPTRTSRQPEAVKPFLTADQLRLYDLIWKRMVASQMAPALYDTATADIEGKTLQRLYLLRAAGSVLRFPGFIILYQEGKDEAEAAPSPPLPPLAVGEALACRGVYPEQHFTQPPPRYSEASLIRALEERGIGRPSTYAPIIATLKARGYVERQGGRLHPFKLGMVVSDLLCAHFPDVVDLSFTAQMEDRLDAIARGEEGWLPVVKGFYQPFSQSLRQAASNISRVRVEEEVEEPCPVCGGPMVVKRGRFGSFLSCRRYPECSGKKPYQIKLGIACPQCGGELAERRSKKGRTFYGCLSYPDCKFASFYRPLPTRCPQCGGLLVQSRRGQAKCLGCGKYTRAPAAEGVPA